jgi:chromatin segregation and condensation protein Rec8/ScpA/Scc1 (kleisin family)
MLAMILEIKLQALLWAYKDKRTHFTREDMRDEIFNRYPR